MQEQEKKLTEQQEETLIKTDGIEGVESPVVQVENSTGVDG